MDKEFTYEVKCPKGNKNIAHYLDDNNDIRPKFKAQMLLQMFFCNRSKGYFCVAEPDFEKSRKVILTQLEFDSVLLKDLLQKAFQFWAKAIFPILCKTGK